MTNPQNNGNPFLTEEVSRLSWHVATRYFAGITDVMLHQRITHLLTWVHSWHQSYAQGPLLGAIVVTYLDPAPRPEAHPYAAGHALLRLQMINGEVFALQFRGNLHTGLERLETIAAHLNGGTAASGPVVASAFLTTLVNGEAPAERRCEVVLCTRASMGMSSPLRQHMVMKVTLEGLNRIRQSYGLRPLNRLPPLLADHALSMIGHLDEVFASYRKRLEPSALSLVEDFSVRYHRCHDDLRAYNFLVSSSQEATRNRIQAVTALPWLLRLLARLDYPPLQPVGLERSNNMMYERAIRQIVEAIDQGRPLYESVAAAFRVRKETIRWSSRRMLPFSSYPGIARVELLLKALSWLPPEKRPTSDREWDDLHLVVRPLLSVLAAGQDRYEFTESLLDNPRYGNVMCQWLRELARPDLAAARQAINRMRQQRHDVSEIKDYVGALLCSLHRYGLDPVFGSGDVFDFHRDALLDWLASQPLHYVARLSQGWHASLAASMEEYSARAQDLHEPNMVWPAVLPSPFHRGRLVIAELSDARSLVDEGVAMKHCVGRYALNCMSGDAMILSIKDIGGLHLSTAEVAIDATLLRTSVRQHRGMDNGPASPECSQALDEIITLLNSNKFRAQLAHRTEFQRLSRQRQRTSRHFHPDGAGDYHRIAEGAAWSITFGTLPDEKSVDFRAAYLGSGK
jgi:hypothetical protein